MELSSVFVNNLAHKCVKIWPPEGSYSVVEMVAFIALLRKNNTASIVGG